MMEHFYSFLRLSRPTRLPGRRGIGFERSLVRSSEGDVEAGGGQGREKEGPDGDDVRR